MLVATEWLREYVDIDWTDEEIASKLTIAGLNVANVIDLPIRGKITCGIVREVSPHPRSEKLHVCKVFDGDSVHTTITSDMNICKGTKVPVAFPGTTLSDGRIVEAMDIKGITSEVIMCSLQELGLEEKSECVYQIREEIPVGTDLIRYWKLDGKVLDIEITPNRPDCLGVIGVAREMAVLSGRPLKKPSVDYTESDKPVNDMVSVFIKDVDGCPRYCAAFMESVKAVSSPVWMRRRLMSAGIRPINSIVDAANYVMLETGHPVHTFDYSKISSGRIVVRKANKSERVLLLDEREYSLHGIETLITDGEKVLAVGGVMGTADSGVSDKTDSLLLEVAYFNPVRIRKTSRSMNIKSDASYRFERGVDPNDVDFVMKRLIKVIEETSGGVAARGFVDKYVHKIPPRTVFLRDSKLSRILGIDIDQSSVEHILSGLDFVTERITDGWKVLIPTFRPDISIEEDLIEEVGRIYGYEKIEGKMLRIPVKSTGFGELQRFRKKINQLLIASGFDESINLSFCSSSVVKKLVKMEPVRLKNPLSEDMDCLRPSLVFGLIDSVAYNLKRQLRDVKLFEIAKVYNFESGTVCEREKIGLVMTGKLNEDDYTDYRTVSLLNLKGVLDELANHLSVQFEVAEKEMPFFVPGRSAEIFLNDKSVGVMGMLSGDFNDFYDFKGDVYFMELDLQVIFENRRIFKQIGNLSSFPSVRRDISLLAPVGFNCGKIVSHLKQSSEYVEKVGVSDIYRGKDIPQDVLSITFYVVYRAPDRSLTDEEVNDLFEKTVSEIETRFNLKRRFS